MIKGIKALLPSFNIFTKFTTAKSYAFARNNDKYFIIHAIPCIKLIIHLLSVISSSKITFMSYSKAVYISNITNLLPCLCMLLLSLSTQPC